MFDVFSEEIEVLIKEGIANLYWFKGDLHKAWLRSGVSLKDKEIISRLRDQDQKELTKRRQMDALYEKLRKGEYNRRLEISRNFVRILVEQTNFVPQDAKHRIELAERCSLKLREIMAKQVQEREERDRIRIRKEKEAKDTYELNIEKLKMKFIESEKLPPQERGYALEKIFTELMKISGIQVEEPFKIDGEQFDGAIKYDSHYYLIELKWTSEKTPPKDIGHFCFKVEGKYQARGIFISMNGFTENAISTLPRGKEIKAILLDGTHLSKVIFGIHRFQELLEHAISEATLRGNIYCSHEIK